MTWRHVHGGVLRQILLTTACWFIEASTVPVREIATTQGVQIFGSVASSRSRLHLAMRNPRQPRRTAPIRTLLAANTAKHLAGRRNSGVATSGLNKASCPGFAPLKRATRRGTCLIFD